METKRIIISKQSNGRYNYKIKNLEEAYPEESLNYTINYQNDDEMRKEYLNAASIVHQLNTQT